ncbi:MAG: 1-acyl-sn-glycerol-3-phosphate acyltransferase [Clostridia bacterium]|nr:1-acyl-sn-glycerol-3-phosphate acyltransferase [Clostridia bacterium]
MGFYDNCIRLLAGVFQKVYRINIIGAENIPSDDRPFLLCCNHIHAMDPFVTIAVLKIKVYYVAKEELFRIPLVGSVIRAFGCVPIKRGAGDVGAIKKTIELLNDGKPVGIFPQGHRNPGVPPRGTQIHNGTGMVLQRTGARVLPVCIHTKNHKLSLFRKTDIIIGRPMEAEEFSAVTSAEQNNNENYRAVTEYVFGEICAMDEKQTQAEALLP